MNGQLVTVYRGPMFSGKTKRLVLEYGSGEGVVVFRPAIDSRYGDDDRIYSFDGQSVPAILIDHSSPDQIVKMVDTLPSTTKVIVDEVSFFPTKEFIYAVGDLTDKGIKVVVGGLDYDANQNPWGPVLELVKMPGIKDVKLVSRCEWEVDECIIDAEWSFRKKPVKAILAVGGKGLYGAACTKHHVRLHHVPKKI